MNRIWQWLKLVFCQHRRTHTVWTRHGSDLVEHQTTCIDCGKSVQTPRAALDNYGRGPMTLGHVLGFKYDA